MSEITVSIIFATYKRERILQKTLEALKNLDASSFQYEIIVVDNASEKPIEELVSFYKEKVTYLKEDRPGKNSALLTGLKKSSGEVLVFIDDDILVEKNWLNQLISGIDRLPQFDIFGGKILPYLAPDIIDELGLLQLESSFIRSAYGIADWQIPEGAIKAGHIWGGNMAVRRRVFEAGISFDPTIGPLGKNYIMGSETDFLVRAERAGFKGAFIPDAVVKHQIGRESLTFEWLWGRAFRWGRGEARRDPPQSRFMIFNIPFFLIRTLVVLQAKYIFMRINGNKDWVMSCIYFNIVKGKIFQLYKDRKIIEEK